MQFRASAPSAADSLQSPWLGTEKPGPAPSKGEPDKRLMEAAQRGDRGAFAAIIERHQGAIYGYLRSRLVEPADAEDLSQEVFLRCYISPARFDHSAMVRPWLFGIARNLLREHVRRVKRRREVTWTELCLELEEMVDLA